MYMGIIGAERIIDEVEGFLVGVFRLGYKLLVR